MRALMTRREMIRWGALAGAAFASGEALAQRLRVAPFRSQLPTLPVLRWAPSSARSATRYQRLATNPSESQRWQHIVQLGEVCGSPLCLNGGSFWCR
jgi:hypothetical protein